MNLRLRTRQTNSTDWLIQRVSLEMKTPKVNFPFKQAASSRTRNRTSPRSAFPLDSTSTITAFERSRPAADATRGMYGAVVACPLR